MADFITQFTAEEYVNRDNFNNRITQANTGLATVQSAAAAAQSTANGKANSSHTHAAGDISSGTLPISRGGTGQTTAAGIRNAMGLGNTTAALPVANGGTGATTAAVARTALEITPANIGAVPTLRTINGKALSADVTLTAADVGSMVYDFTTDFAGINVLNWALTKTQSITANLPDTALGLPFTAFWRIKLDVIGNWRELKATDINYPSHQFTNTSWNGAAWEGWIGAAILNEYGKVNASQSTSRWVDKTSSFTLSWVDQNCMLHCYSSSAITVTIPAHASVALPVGTEIEILRSGVGGAVTITPAPGVSMHSSGGLSATASRNIADPVTAATLKKFTNNDWVLIGNLE